MVGQRGAQRETGQWRSPSSFTALVPLAVGTGDASVTHAVSEARKRIETHNEPMIAECEKLDVIHSLRLVVIPHLHEDQQRPYLLVNFVHDKATDEAALEIVAPIFHEHVAPSLEGVSTLMELKHALLHSEFQHHTLFLANINTSVRQIRQERILYERLQGQLDKLAIKGPLGEKRAGEIRDLLSSAYKAQANGDTPPADLLAGPAEPVSNRGLRVRRFDLLRGMFNPVFAVLYEDILKVAKRSNSSLRWLWIVLGGLYILLAGLVAIPALAGVRLVELFEPNVEVDPPPAEELDRIEDSEDQVAKNAVTLVFPVKHSWIRRVLVAQVLNQAELGCRHLWTDGRLVQIRTIHYARILLTPSRRTMLFLSDYDGSLNRYLDDFLGVGKRAVVPISSNVHGCPPTKWLGTPLDMSQFRPRWRLLIRKHQVLESFWFNAYPYLSASQIRNHHEVRQGLFKTDMTEDEAIDWLRRL